MPAPRTILVVEDDSTVRMLITEVLEDEDYTVLEAADGNEAKKYFNDKACGIDLMMTDRKLPDIDGLVLAALAREERPTLPIVLASGLVEDIDTVPDYVQIVAKPFSIDRLRDTVRGLLGES